MWRLVEALDIPALGIVSQHPRYPDGDFDPTDPCRYFIRVRPLLLRVGKGQQCGQTLPGYRVGQEGHQTQPGSAVTPRVDGAGEAHMN
jgi:hypothetical protein